MTMINDVKNKHKKLSNDKINVKTSQ